MRQISFKLIVSISIALVLFSGCEKDSVAPVVTTPTPPPTGGGPVIPPSGPRVIYVSADSGNDANTNPFSQATPYKTLNRAASVTMPGDEVQIMNGTYTPPTDGDPNNPILKITRSGTASAYITYKAYPGAYPVLYSSGQKWNAVIVNASYIIVDGLELKGDNNNNPNSLLAGAIAAQQDHRAGIKDWTRFSQFNTNGLSIASGSGISVHHVEIRNCKIHDFAGGGIGAGRTDYITVSGNKVYNNSWFTMYGTSGISFLLPYNSDGITNIYKYKITGNTCYNNYPQVPYYNSSTSQLSDGNGIIIDIGTADLGRTLVENNICYLNGGGGIHAFKAYHVDVLNNTTYMNEQKLAYGNIDANQSNDVVFRNNIAYAKPGGKANDTFSGSNISFDNNVYFNGTVKSGTGGANSIIADPLFVNPAAGDFSLQSTSPAINAGMATSISGTITDFLGNIRLKNGKIDCGAYEIN